MARIYLSSRPGQFLIVLLAALADLGHSPSKREVENHVEKAGHLRLSPELLQAYESKPEPKWKTLLAYARRNAVEKGYMKHLIRPDAWEISDSGFRRFAAFEEEFKSGKFDPKEFEFLSSAFFARMGAPNTP